MRAIIIQAMAASLAIGSSDAQAPSLAKVEIANGSFNTAGATVSLRITATGEPTAYRASETKDLTGVAWRSLSSSPSFTLSATPGFKTVYVQVGRSAAISTSQTSPTRTTQTVTSPLPGGFVPAPSYVSNIMADTIVLGLPDLRATVELPAVVHDNSSFSFWVTVKNTGQINPSAETIQLYNSFVTNTIVLDRVEVPFGVSRLTGRGCVITDVSTIECAVAPIALNGAVGVNVFAHTQRALPANQTSVKFTLRTRITGVRESNTTNNWVDTPITIVR